MRNSENQQMITVIQRRSTERYIIENYHKFNFGYVLKFQGSIYTNTKFTVRYWSGHFVYQIVVGQKTPHTRQIFNGTVTNQSEY